MKWKLGNLELNSRLFLGSSGYPSLQFLLDCVRESQAELVTVALRRIDLSANDAGLIPALKKTGCHLLPNTAGCQTAEEACLTAELARESLGTTLIKLEVIGDRYSLYPDSEELLKAAAILSKKGFQILPYCGDDPVLCKKLEQLGCLAVMPLASPIGSGQGIQNRKRIELICSQVSVPVILDAGLGTASDAALALELGCQAVLVNSAISKAQNPVAMAKAMAQAAESGLMAFQAGRIPEKKMATPSTPDQGKMRFTR